VPRSFLFAGRFVSEKGVDQLVKAYESYRERSIDPWPLVCCGAGPLGSRLEGRPGIRVEGFVQPDRLCDILASAGCLVLPSTFEPWAIVVHEAASAGLLILASDIVGAAVHLVQDNYNGYIFDCRDVKGLSALMSHVSDLSDVRLDAMSRASHLLSKQFSPARWADTLLDGFRTFSQL
jgi:glycosyltransferase involved in cell wall biosynthesis